MRGSQRLKKKHFGDLVFDQRESGQRRKILGILNSLESPVPLEKLFVKLRPSPSHSLESLAKELSLMKDDCLIIETSPEEGFRIFRETEELSGTVSVHSDGYGFVKTDCGTPDIYLSRRETKGLFDTDRVLVRVFRKRDRAKLSGRVLRLLSAKSKRLVGRFFSVGGRAYVIPLGEQARYEIFIPRGKSKGAKNGDAVVAEITERNLRSSLSTGLIVNVLGDCNSSALAVEEAICKFDLRIDWPQGVLRQVRAVRQFLTDEDVGTRRDLRDMAFVTIDGTDAKDFDDAVHVKKTPKGYVLHVAIADVSHYVPRLSPVDSEALNRGTSVYFPDKVIPMLPEPLSNGICSLVPNEDRLALVCKMFVKEDGKVFRSAFFEAVVRSKARLNYDEVNKYFREKIDILGISNTGVLKNLLGLQRLYERLRNVKRERGALDIELGSQRLLFDEEKKVCGIVETERLDSHRAIEECMILANVAAAKYLSTHKLEGLYRTHEQPTEYKRTALSALLQAFEFQNTLGGSNDPKEFSTVLREARKRKDCRVIEMAVLRSMQLASYSPFDSGHFGLALESYAHFTSPIRRYPDLLVHRQIKASIGKKGIEKYPRLMEIAKSTSDCERTAEAAEREVLLRNKIALVETKIGEHFTGMITGVTRFGVFVELMDCFVEGLVHISQLPVSSGQFDSSAQAFRNQKGEIVFCLGQKVKVRVEEVSVEENKITLNLVRSRNVGGRHRSKRKEKRAR